MRDPASKKDVALEDMASGCVGCVTRSLCLGEGLNQQQLKGLERIITIRGPYRTGQAIYRLEERFNSLFIIRAGTVKTESVSQEGNNLVDGFFFQGDVFGMEAIGSATYEHDAVALEETWVCELPFEQFESLCQFVPRLQHKIMLLFGQKMRHTNQSIVHGRCQSVEQRLMGFLRMLCQKSVLQDEKCRSSVQLVMTKGDIASYLGLRPESLSRALRKLQSRGIIRNHGKRVEVLNVSAVSSEVCK
ncbi:MAG: helix-turn-helix domain-containing protein [Gammaproteobacteria bacterium]|nr:helix-turn-helix domain-containing protein [Gammaproteobacteria bacterium]